ncbi:MAG: putative hydrolase of the superfamily [Nocardioidaceae bacterium]|nr:putative hydrolase of the superfamily [Nocardioidaceae bacterium]
MSDLDDTLVVRPPLFRAWAEQFLASVGAPADLLEWVIEQDRGGHRPRKEFLGALAARTGYDVPVDTFLDSYNEAIAGSYRLTGDTRAALAAARAAGWSLAVVTNGPTDVQSRKVEASGLADLVDALCISEEVGARKPEPLIFETAARRSGATLQGAWMVGDNLDADIAGAQRVGARSVWVKRDYDWLDYTSGTEPDLVAESFPDAVRQVLEATR